MRTLAFALVVSLLPLTAAVADGPSATVLVASDGVLGAPGGSRSTCTVSVGQTLKAALDGAVGAGCLPALTYTTYPFGRFVECVGDLCNDYGLAPFSVDGHFWILYENDVSASEGVDGLRVDDGDVFALSYDRCPFVTCVPTYAFP